jgi:hypothetical protein
MKPWYTGEGLVEGMRRKIWSGEESLGKEREGKGRDGREVN